MSVLRPRKRVLFFRVSEDEFERFNRICESTGARSVSDLARSAMQTMLQESRAVPGDSVSEKLSALETMVRDLNGKIHELTVSLGHRSPNGEQAGTAVKNPSNGTNRLE